MKYYYDFHIHSCLSPCGDDDSTPYNIAGMGVINGLNIMALTDHNSCKNCPAFYTAAKRQGIIPIAGMELTTSEDIHVVCLFQRLEDAMAFSEEVEKRRILIANRVDIFGSQLVYDAEDNVIEAEPNLLSNATTVSLDEAPLLVENYGGICYPAHIDRSANGIISTLGTFPPLKGVTCAEFRSKEAIEEYTEKYGLQGLTKIVSSDAHYLWDISEKENFFEIDDEPYSGDLVRERLFKMLRGEL